MHYEPGDRARLVSFAVKRSRVPVFVNVGHSTLEGAVQLGQQAVQSGAAALLLTPPYYFRYQGPEIREFYLRFASEITGSCPPFTR